VNDPICNREWSLSGSYSGSEPGAPSRECSSFSSSNSSESDICDVTEFQEDGKIATIHGLGYFANCPPPPPLPNKGESRNFKMAPMVTPAMLRRGRSLEYLFSFKFF